LSFCWGIKVTVTLYTGRARKAQQTNAVVDRIAVIENSHRRDQTSAIRCSMLERVAFRGVFVEDASDDQGLTRRSVAILSIWRTQNARGGPHYQIPAVWIDAVHHDRYSACTAAAAMATLYMMPVTACQNGNGSICSALIGTTIVSPGLIWVFEPRLNHRLPSLATTLPSA
jgi:hypothetical protein